MDCARVLILVENVVKFLTILVLNTSMLDARVDERALLFHLDVASESLRQDVAQPVQ